MSLPATLLCIVTNADKTGAKPLAAPVLLAMVAEVGSERGITGGAQPGSQGSSMVVVIRF